MKNKIYKYKISDNILQDMNKGQLISKIKAYEDLLEIYYNTYFMLSSYLVDESKWHITKDECIVKIRNELNKADIKIYLAEEEYDIDHC